MAELTPRRYADQLVDWLSDASYTHCFFVGGGNIMHLLDAVRTRMTCVPVVHEVAAAIAAEYFNETSASGRAFALVTAGPGLTNAVTGISSAWMESRELLVIGGQVKSDDLSRGTVRQLGHQEGDGIGVCSPISKVCRRLEQPVGCAEFLDLVSQSWRPRKGPVVIEVCLDVGAGPPVKDAACDQEPENLRVAETQDIEKVARRIAASERPLLLLGGGVSRESAAAGWSVLESLGLPVAATWNGADRVPSELTVDFGRPNTYGMRWSNVLLQQSDCLVAIGTRLGLQQTGFAVDRFAAGAHLVQVDIDPAELAKGRPALDTGICGDADDFLGRLLEEVQALVTGPAWRPWREFGREVKELLPTCEASNSGRLVDPFVFVRELGLHHASGQDVVIPCSSGNTFNVVMQAFPVKAGQRMVTDKGAASMGYGLSGAIGAALANPGRRVIHFEGDGGFAQNLQELGTVEVNALPIKMVLFINDGYASIRQMQRHYFDGDYVGCDRTTGVGLPNWLDVARAFRIPAVTVDSEDPFSAEVQNLLNAPGPAMLLVPVDRDQTYWPKITSAVDADGVFRSNPLHLMSPALPEDVASRVLRYLDMGARR